MLKMRVHWQGKVCMAVKSSMEVLSSRFILDLFVGHKRNRISETLAENDLECDQRIRVTEMEG